METFLVLWALGLALDAIFPCLFGDAVSKASLSSPAQLLAGGSGSPLDAKHHCIASSISVVLHGHAPLLPNLAMLPEMCLRTVQAVCWGAKAWQSWLHMLAVMLLVPCLNVFGGLTIAHSYLAATGQTSYEIIKGAKVSTTPSCR